MRRSQIGEFLKVKLPAVLAIASSTGMICDSDRLHQSHTNITKKTCVTDFILRVVGSSVVHHTQKHGCILIQIH